MAAIEAMKMENNEVVLILITKDYLKGVYTRKQRAIEYGEDGKCSWKKVEKKYCLAGDLPPTYRSLSL
jgi:hypothetical protein